MSPSPLQQRHRPFRNNVLSRHENSCCLERSGDIIWSHEKSCRSLLHMATMASCENKNLRRSRSATTFSRGKKIPRRICIQRQ